MTPDVPGPDETAGEDFGDAGQLPAALSARQRRELAGLALGAVSTTGIGAVAFSYGWRPGALVLLALAGLVAVALILDL